MSEILFSTHMLHKSFGGLHVTNGISLKVARSEFRAIIGPNGAGKSTFFNLVTGFLKPDSGEILFEGKEITGKKPYSLFPLGLSRTFQIANIFSNLSVMGNVQVALLSHHRKLFDFIRDAEKRFVDSAHELLSQVGLEDLAERSASELSHGDRKKLELAVALTNEPKILFLDEPTAGMAADERIQAIRLVRHIAQERDLTVVFTEHDMQVVFEVADRISVLHQGRIISEGLPQEIRNSKDVQRVYLGESF